MLIRWIHVQIEIDDSSFFKKKNATQIYLQAVNRILSRKQSGLGTNSTQIKKSDQNLLILIHKCELENY